jgi:hypothetical protein
VLALDREPPFTDKSLARLLESERTLAKRQALVQHANTRAKDTFSVARAMVQKLRECEQEFIAHHTGGLLPALGLTLTEPADALAEATLQSTEDAFVELDRWALKRADVQTSRRALMWEDRVHSLAHTSAMSLVALPDRVASCLRWTQRCGLTLDHTLLQDHVGPSQADAEGVALECADRVRIVGHENHSMRGTIAIAHTVGQGIALTRGWPSVLPRARWGVDQVGPLVIGALVQQLCLTREFVHREWAIDRAQTEALTRASLHCWMYQLRVMAAQAVFAHDALQQKTQLAERYRERMIRAIACADEPAWTAHHAANILTDRAEADLWAQLFAVWMFAALRDEFEEDFFRNPKCGERLGQWMDAIRLMGVEAWFRAVSLCPAEQPVLSVLTTALVARVSEKAHAL